MSGANDHGGEPPAEHATDASPYAGSAPYPDLPPRGERDSERAWRGSHKNRCPVCESSALTDCLRIRGVPLFCNQLHDSREDALAAPRGDIHLVFCGNCGHLFNAAFDASRVEYTGEYENSLHHSARFREYAASLAEQLVELHDLRGKTIIEIACGQGDFLHLLCSLGGNQGIGFDPGHVPGRGDLASGGDLRFIQDYYSDAYAHQRADLICCRHALEHLDRPADFLRLVRRAIADQDARIFFEVPNARFTLEDMGIWDIIYEHCGYFSDSSLRRVFERNGFRVNRIEPAFGGQFLTLHGGPAPAGSAEPVPATGDVTGLAAEVSRFSRVYAEKVERWRARLEQLGRSGRRTLLWGAGSKGVSFMNTLAVGDEIDYLVDLNPHKQGRFIPGTGHPVRSPRSVAASRPDTIIVMNPLYAQEIGRDLRGLGVEAEILLDDLQ